MPEIALTILAVVDTVAVVVAMVLVFKLSQQIKLAQEALVEDRRKIAQITRAISSRPGNDPVEPLESELLTGAGMPPVGRSNAGFAAGSPTLAPGLSQPLGVPSIAQEPQVMSAGRYPGLSGALPSLDLYSPAEAALSGQIPRIGGGLGAPAPVQRGGRRDRPVIPFGEDKTQQPSRSNMVPPMNPALSRAGAEARKNANVMHEKAQLSALWAAEEERRLQEKEVHAERIRRKSILHNDVPEL